MSRSRRFPPSPERYPFFYGWVIVAVGTLGVVSSIPGQTMGVSVFAPRLMEALRLSSTQLSIAYGLGTLVSGLFLVRAGRLVDRFGVRRAMVLVSVCSGLTLLLLSSVGIVAERISSVLGSGTHTAVAMIVITLGFFLLRFLGQGLSALVPRVMIGKWFHRRRGLAVGVSGVLVSFGFGYAPVFFNSLVHAYGWRGAYGLLGLMVGVGMGSVAWAFYREQPEDFGLVKDGALPDTEEERGALHAVRDFTVEEARRSYEFWVYTAGLASQGLIITGLTFHILAITREAGLSEHQGLSIFLPMALVSVFTNMAAGWIGDRTELKYLLMVQMAALTLATVSMTMFGDFFWRSLAIVGFGISGGLFNNVIGVAWARFYGTLHLGAISGQNMAIMVVTTAVGPLLFAASFSITGSYAAGLLLTACFPVSMFFAAAFSGNPQHRAR